MLRNLLNINFVILFIGLILLLKFSNIILITFIGSIFVMVNLYLFMSNGLFNYSNINLLIENKKLKRQRNRNQNKNIRNNLSLKDKDKKLNELDELFNSYVLEIKYNSGLPSLEILRKNEIKLDSEIELKNKADKVIKELEKFNIYLELKEILRNSKLNQLLFLLKDGLNKTGDIIPADIKKFISKESQIKNKLQTSNVRLLEVVEGTEYIGIEFNNSNADKNLLSLYDLINSVEYKNYDKEITIPIAYGERSNGSPYIFDLMTAPHILIGGATGSGKSVALSIMISNILFNYSPKDIELYLIDPKLVEFTIFENLPHLGMSISKTAEEANQILISLVATMKERYTLFEKSKVKNINSYNLKHKDNIDLKLKRIVCIIDELADIMESGIGKEFEGNLNQLLRLARASGIHIIFATQRPSAEILSGEIKSNAPFKIALKTATQTDSNVIINKAGAELLVGKGDSLISFNGNLERVQCAFISESELDNLINFWINK